MAKILHSAIFPPNYNDPSIQNVNIKEVPIGGKLIRVKREYSSFDELLQQDAAWKSEVKLQLASDLSKFLLNGYAEFTMQKDASSGMTTVYATCYLAPNGEVKVLREWVKP